MTDIEIKALSLIVGIHRIDNWLPMLTADMLMAMHATFEYNNPERSPWGAASLLYKEVAKSWHKCISLVITSDTVKPMNSPPWCPWYFIVCSGVSGVPLHFMLCE